MGHMTCSGIFWTLVSLVVGVMHPLSLWFPYWIQGELSGRKVFLSPFRRCNYPQVTFLNTVQVIDECAFYTSFGDIPSTSWQITTLLIITSSIIIITSAVFALFGCFLDGFLTKGRIRTIGIIQFFCALFTMSAVGIFPFGFTSDEVRNACGSAASVYKFGGCKLSWSIYSLTVSTSLLFLAFILSSCACDEVKSNKSSTRSSISSIEKGPMEPKEDYETIDTRDFKDLKDPKMGAGIKEGKEHKELNKKEKSSDTKSKDKKKGSKDQFNKTGSPSSSFAHRSYPVKASLPQAGHRNSVASFHHHPYHHHSHHHQQHHLYSPPGGRIHLG